MHSLEKLNNLFIRHLKTIYQGEFTLVKALDIMSRVTNDENLRRFYAARSGEKRTSMMVLKKALHAMGLSAEGERDPVITSFTEQVYDPRLTEGKALYIATMIFGRTLGVYLHNSWQTAISCAQELGMYDLAEELSSCSKADKFSKTEFEFLRHHAVERIAETVAA